MKKTIITGLDIGSSKICATIAELKSQDDFRILGAATYESKGLSGGGVSDLRKLTDSIFSSLSAVEDEAGKKAHNVIVNVGGPHVNGSSYEAALSISSLPRIVIRRDVNRVNNVAKDLSISLGEEPIHIVPLGYSLDAQEGIENPLGLYGTKLKTRLYIISCASNLIRNITKAVNNAGYEISNIAYSGLAASHVLSDEEKT